MQGEFIIYAIIIFSPPIVVFYYDWKARQDEKKKEELFENYMAHYHCVISFTIHKDVSAEIVRFWDSEARRLSDEIGGNTNYDEMILELEQDLNNNFDTGWWKE